MRVLTPETIKRFDLPCHVATPSSQFSIFLGGSIEMGQAEDWQKEVISKFKDENVTILNPRRNDWNPSWEQSKDNRYFRHQVEWELDAQEMADVLLYYFQPGTQSPITLLELGMFANRGRNVIVVCPEGFWRKGNVDIVAIRNKCHRVQSLDEAVQIALEIKTELEDQEEIPF